MRSLTAEPESEIRNHGHNQSMSARWEGSSATPFGFAPSSGPDRYPVMESFTGASGPAGPTRFFASFGHSGSVQSAASLASFASFVASDSGGGSAWFPMAQVMMGVAIARALAAQDHALVLMSPGGSAEALAAELGAIGVNGSVTRAGDLEKLVGAAMDAHGRIDAVANNTGFPPKGPLLEIPDEDWHDGLDMVLMNVIRMARLVTPIMAGQGGGAIVNISTYAAVEPSPAYPVSATFRAGLSAFTKLYADRYAPRRHPHEQHPARLHRYPRRRRRGGGRHPRATLRNPGRGGRNSGVPALRGRRLHHRPEPPHRWRADAVGVGRRFPHGCNEIQIASSPGISPSSVRMARSVSSSIAWVCNGARRSRFRASRSMPAR